MAEEVTGLHRNVDAKQQTASEDSAREIEQAILAKYDKNKLASNGEILSGVDPMMVAAEIGTLMRSRSTDKHVHEFQGCLGKSALAKLQNA